MNVRQIEAFYAIMKVGSISGAAKRMHISQPAVSRILQHTESQLGFELFHRSASGMVPTEKALRLFPHIERIFIDLSLAEDHARILRGDAKNALRISVVPALSLTILPQTLLAVREANPGCELLVQTQHSGAILQATALHEIDVGIAFDVPYHSGISSTILCADPIVCVAPIGLFPMNKPVSLADVSKHNLIRIDVRDPLGEVLNRAFANAEVVTVSSVTVQTYHVALGMAQARLGITLIDAISASSADLNVMSIHPLESELTLSISALWPKQVPLKPLAESYVAEFSSALKKLQLSAR